MVDQQMPLGHPLIFPKIKLNNIEDTTKYHICKDTIS